MLALHCNRNMDYVVKTYRKLCKTLTLFIRKSISTHGQITQGAPSREGESTVVAIMVKTFDTKSHLTLPVVHSNISQAGRDMVTSLTSSIERTCKLLETFTGLKNPLGLTTDFIDGRHVFSNKSWVTRGGIFEPIVQSLYQTLHHADISVTISSKVL